MTKKTRFALCLLLALLVTICGQLERYTLTVTATNRTIEAKDRHGEPITLTECRTEDGERILLEDVTEGNSYRVTLDSCGTWSTEDDAIITVKGVSE